MMRTSQVFRLISRLISMSRLLTDAADLTAVSLISKLINMSRLLTDDADLTVVSFDFKAHQHV